MNARRVYSSGVLFCLHFDFVQNPKPVFSPSIGSLGRDTLYIREGLLGEFLGRVLGDRSIFHNHERRYA